MLIFNSASAANTLIADRLKAEAATLNLAYHPTWGRLLHYRSPAQATTRNKSRITTKDFFLHPLGASNPQLELQATIEAYLSPAGDTPNAHPRCRFPARYLWLKRHINLPPFDDHCSSFENWKRDKAIENITVIFASGQFTNAASFFGHVLILLEEREQTQSTELLNVSLNYGALIPENENGFAYVFKGLFGGYDAAFSNREFFYQNHAYAHEGQRDLWLYELDLDPNKVDLLVAHAWELYHARFKYYFIRDNCGFEMMEFLSLVIKDIKAPKKFWYTPLDLFNTLEASTEVSFKGITRRPSTRSRFQGRYSSLSISQRRALRQKLKRPRDDPESPRFQALKPVEQSTVLDALIAYTEINSRGKNKKKNQANTADRARFIQQRLTLPARLEPEQEPDMPAPTEDQNTSMFRLGSYWLGQEHLGLEMHIRPAYRDVLSMAQIDQTFGLSVGELRLGLDSRGPFIRRLDLLSVTSLGLSKTGLPADSGFAWTLRTGAQQQAIEGSDRLSAVLHLGVGKAFPLGERALIYGLIEGQTQTPHFEEGHLSVGPHISVIAKPTNWWAWQIQGNYGRYLDRSINTYDWSAEQRFGASKIVDFRFKVGGRKRVEEIAISGGFYW
jgi:hypothetical protein